MAKEEDDIRMVVKVNKHAHPELFQELSRMGSSHRSERIRTLASFYLNGASGNHQKLALTDDTGTHIPEVHLQQPVISTQAKEPVETEEDRRARELAERRANFKDSLKSSF